MRSCRVSQNELHSVYNMYINIYAAGGTKERKSKYVSKCVQNIFVYRKTNNFF